MLRTLLIFCGIIAFSSSQACNPFDGIKGSGNIKKEIRNIKGFDGIENCTSSKVVIKQGDFGITVEADDNIISHVKTEENDGKLHISMDGFTNFSSYKLTVYVSLPKLSSLVICGSGELMNEGIFNTEDLNVEIKGSGNINLKSQGNNLNTTIRGSGDLKHEGNYEYTEVVVQGSGDLKMNGKSNKLNVEIQGSGDLNASDLVVTTAQVEIKGSGDCYLNVSSSISASIHGSGDIKYKGAANIANFSKNGSGEIIKTE